MKKITVLSMVVSVCLLSVVFATMAFAADPCGDHNAVTVYACDLGTQKGGGAIATDRDDPNAALGPIDNDFVSLGFLVGQAAGGYIVLDFGEMVGTCLTVVEQSPGTEYQYSLEQAEVYVSGDAIDWTYVGTANNQIAPGSATGQSHVNVFEDLGCFQYVKIVDTTDPSPFSNTADAFDVDAVYAGDCVEPATYAICGTKYAEWQGQLIPLPGWKISLSQDDLLVAETLTDENGRYCFTDLPAGTYEVSEELKPGWEQVDPIGSHTVTLPGGGSSADSVVYGIERYSGDVYGVDVLTGDSWLEFEMPTPPGANSASPNGLGYDPLTGRFYYTDYQLGTTPDTLYFWDGSQHVAGQLAQGSTVACADIFEGKYYYIPSNENDVRVVSFNPDGTILSDDVLQANIGMIGDHNWTFNGDIAVKDGVLYGWGECSHAGHGYEFFVYDFDAHTTNLYVPTYQQSLQLAFGADGVLYGHRSGGDGPFYLVDTASGAVTPVGVAPDLQFTDCASARSVYNFINTPKMYCYDDTVWAYGGCLATANNLVDGIKSNNWGWTNLIPGPGTYVMELWAGAGQNDLTKGVLVGTVAVEYDGDCVTVTYQIDEGLPIAYKLSEAHLWIGDTPLPLDKKGIPTDAPGKLGYAPEIAPDGLSATFTLCGVEAPFYVAAHGVVDWCVPDPDALAEIEAAQ